MKLEHKKRGDHLSAEDWNAVVDELKRLGRWSVAPPLWYSTGAGGSLLSIQNGLDPHFWGRITAGTSTAHTFGEVDTNADGTTYDVTGARTGTAAMEINGWAAVPADTVVRMWECSATNGAAIYAFDVCRGPKGTAADATGANTFDVEGQGTNRGAFVDVLVPALLSGTSSVTLRKKRLTYTSNGNLQLADAQADDVTFALGGAALAYTADEVYIHITAGNEIQHIQPGADSFDYTGPVDTSGSANTNTAGVTLSWTTNTAEFEAALHFDGVTAGTNTLSVTIPQTIADLADVVTSSPSSGQLLRFDGTNWANWTPTYSSGTSTASVIELNVHYSGTASTTLQIGTFDARMSEWGVRIRVATNAASLGQIGVSGYWRDDSQWYAATGHEGLTTFNVGNAYMEFYVDHDDGDKFKVDLSCPGTNSASAFLAVRVLLWDTLSTADGDYADVP